MKNYRYRKTRIKRVMKGGVVCAPCIAAASGITSGKLMLGAVAGISSAATIRSKRKNHRKKYRKITKKTFKRKNKKINKTKKNY